MRILHTSDWHIGKKLNLISRLDENKKVLTNLVEIIKEKQVDVVMVSGDIYDTFVPSAEAEKLFFEILSKIAQAGAQTIIISGNHDDPTRLTAPKSISKQGGVYFGGVDMGNTTSDAPTNFRTKLIACGDDYFVFEKQGEKVYFATLPYPTELRMREKVDEEETYEEKVSRYINNAIKNAGDLPVVLLAHIFMLGGVSSESERPIDLGGARILPPSIIPNNCIYTALGHLHKRQIVDKNRNILYSGSIMPYSFDEVGIEKSVTLFDVIDGKVQNLEIVKLQGFKPLFKVQTSSIEEAEKMIEQLDGYIELTLTLDQPQSQRVKKLVLENPKLTLKLVYSGSENLTVARKNLNDRQLFTEFYKTSFNSEPSEKLLELYLQFINEIGDSDEA